MFRSRSCQLNTALVLLGATLFLGPANVLLRRPNPVSTDLRRDIGIWSALIGVAHTVVGLQVHFVGRMWLYFIQPLEERGRFPLRLEAFGFANYTGLLATALLVFLLALSNDLSLRRLGRSRWKAFQRLNYALFSLVVLHALLYQTIERRPWPYVSSGILLIVGILGVQLIAAWLVFRHRRVVGR